MKYSFLLPAYKDRFLQSQTYHDFKVIISDDCSPYPLYAIVEPFLSDPRFIYRKNSQNIGAERLVSHWNMLLEECDSPYLIMASDDDIYEPNYLEEMDKLVRKYPEVFLYRSRLDQIDNNGVVTHSERPFNEYEDFTLFVTGLFSDHLHGIGQFIFKRSYLLSIGGFIDFPLAWFSDDASAIVCGKNGSAHSAEILFHIRNSGLNISSKKNNPHFDCLKLKSILMFDKWIQNDNLVPKSVIKKSRSYWFSKIKEIWGSLPIRQRILTLITLPSYSWWLTKDKFNSLLKS